MYPPIEGEEITVEAEQAKSPGDSGADAYVWEEEDCLARREARRDADLTVAADSVGTYLTQIARIALLTAEQEVTLAKRVEAGLYAAERIRWTQDSTLELSPQVRR